jgi:hypothetical protein
MPTPSGGLGQHVRLHQSHQPNFETFESFENESPPQAAWGSLSGSIDPTSLMEHAMGNGRFTTVTAITSAAKKAGSPSPNRPWWEDEMSISPTFSWAMNVHAKCAQDPALAALLARLAAPLRARQVKNGKKWGKNGIKNDDDNDDLLLTPLCAAA